MDEVAEDYTYHKIVDNDIQNIKQTEISGSSQNQLVIVEPKNVTEMNIGNIIDSLISKVQTIEDVKVVDGIVQVFRTF